jgi:hypothetical protein
LHFAVAGLTGYARRDVALVGKVHVVGKSMDTHPCDRLLVFPMFQDLVGFRILQPYQTVTFITRCDSGNARYCRTGGGCMAIEAGNLIVARMDTVAEFDGLNRRWRPAPCQDAPAGEPNGSQE